MQRNIHLLNLFYFTWGFTLYGAIAVLYFQQLAGSYALALSVFTVSLVTAAALEVPTSIFSDIVGRKATMLMGTVANIASIACYALAVDFGLAVVAAVLGGVAMALYSGNTEALLYETLRDSNQTDRYAERFGRANAYFQIGLAASGLGAALLTIFSLKAVFVASLLAPSIWLVAAFWLREPSSHQKSTESIGQHLKDALAAFKKNLLLRRLSFAAILDKGIGETGYQFAPVFIATVWPLWLVGFARFLAGIFGTAGFWFARRWIKKLGDTRAIIYSKLYSRCANLVAFLFPTPVSPVLMQTTDYAYMVGLTAENNLLQKNFTDKQRATMASIVNLAGSIFFGIFALVFGLIADRVPPQQALIIEQLLLLGVFGLYLLALKTRRKQI